MVVPFFRLQSAPGQEGVGDADGGGAAEGNSYVELIIFLQERTVNDVEDVPPMFFPIFHRQLAGDMLQLISHHEIIRAIAVFQRVMHGVHVLIFQLPQEGRTGIVPRAGIRHVKNVTNTGNLPGRVHQGDPLGAAPDIPAHGLIP